MSIKAVLIAVVALLLVLLGYYIRDLQDTTHTQAAVIQQTAQNAKRIEVDQTITSQESQTYAAAVKQAIDAPDPAPAVVCVRKYAAPRPVSEATPAAAGADAGGGLPPGASGPVQPVTDIGGPADDPDKEKAKCNQE